MRCSVIDCYREAECGIAIRVPAMFCPIPEHNPLKVVFGLPLCAECYTAAKMVDFLSDDIKRIFLMMAKGKPIPDFSRAYFEKIDFESDEWKSIYKG